jgi:hypothetical protein
MTGHLMAAGYAALCLGAVVVNVFRGGRCRG